MLIKGYYQKQIYHQVPACEDRNTLHVTHIKSWTKSKFNVNSKYFIFILFHEKDPWFQSYLITYFNLLSNDKFFFSNIFIISYVNKSGETSRLDQINILFRLHSLSLKLSLLVECTVRSSYQLKEIQNGNRSFKKFISS